MLTESPLLSILNGHNLSPASGAARDKRAQGHPGGTGLTVAGDYACSGLSPEEADVDVERSQAGAGQDADVAIERIDLKSQEQGKRKREIKAYDCDGVSEDSQHGSGPLE